MKPLTIKELAAMANAAVQQGYGEYLVCASDDEEFNGSHELYERSFCKGEIVSYRNENSGRMENRPSLILL